MIAQCLYQSDPKNLASMGRQRLACQRAARKLQWGVQKERISETNEPVPLLMRPAVKEILQDAEQHRFDVLLIGNRDSLCCDAADILLLKKGFRICWRKPFFCIVLYPLKSAKALAIKSIGGEDIDGSSFCKFGVCPMLCFSKYSCTICSIQARSVCGKDFVSAFS